MIHMYTFSYINKESVFCSFLSLFVFESRSQRPSRCSASARSQRETDSRTDPAASLGEGYGFNVQAEGAHRQNSEEHRRH